MQNCSRRGNLEGERSVASCRVHDRAGRSTKYLQLKGYTLEYRNKMQRKSARVDDKVANRVANGWVSPFIGKPEKMLNGYETLKKYLKLYCQHCSLVGFKQIGIDRAIWIERFLWLLVYVVAVTSVISVVHTGFQEFEENPFVTSVETEYYPTYKLDFPGIAVCTINRISYKAMRELATEIFDANITDLTIDDIMSSIIQVGDMYESSLMSDDSYEATDQLLSKFYHKDYNIADILKRLTPRCSVMLLNCRFQGETRNCSELFEFRKTEDGFCCTFNYIAQPDDMPAITENVERVKGLKVKTLGRYNGLSLALEPVLEDYYYNVHPIAGWKLMIFNPADYPDMTSGGLSEVLILPRTARIVEMDAVMLRSKNTVMSYPVSKRKCLFRNEVFDNYSYSNCMVNCKVDDIWKTCHCRPFYIPRRGKEEYSRRICGLQDIHCLAKYKSKWFHIIPHEENNAKDEALNKSWTVNCYTCYPMCDDLSYVVTSSKSILREESYLPLLEGQPLGNKSILHVYFYKFGTLALKQDVVARWYELLSDVGGICGVFVGFSLISVAELIYFSTILVCELCTGSSCGGKTEVVEIQPKRPVIQTIYWNELFPRTRLRTKAEGLRENGIDPDPPQPSLTNRYWGNSFL